MSKLRYLVRFAASLGLVTASMLVGCAVGPDFVSPVPPAAARYTREPAVASTIAADGAVQRFVPSDNLPADWWTLFKSAELDATVQQALAHSPTLQAAEASLRQSQDNLRAGDGVFYPQIGATSTAGRERSSPIQQGSAARGSIFSVATLSGTISYPLDVFGGERREVEALGAQVDVQRYTTKAAYLTLSANVVNACIARAAYSAEIRATEQLVALETEQLHTIQAQVRAGVVAYSDELMQQSLIAGNQAALASLRQKLSQVEHLLALLQGSEPDQAALPDIELSSLTLPQSIPVNLPSELVRQRPDILASQAQLHAASANIGVATAAIFPSFNLSATYGSAGSGLDNLLASGGRFWSVGPSITAPLFHGGSLSAQRQAAIDAYDVQQANYRQTVLTAFAQVADALKALEHDAQALQAQLEARRAAGESLGILQANYRAGMVPYVDVLTADVQFHSATLAYLQAVSQRHQDTVALFVALGGGWWNAVPERDVAGMGGTP